VTTSTVKPSAQSAFVSGIAATAIATGNNSALSNVLDNSGATRYGFLCGELLYQFGVAPTAAKAIDIYIETSADGTSFEDAMIASGWVQRISPAADTNAHRVALPRIALKPVAYRVRVVNVDTGQSVTVTLALYTFSDTIES
jgi:hypothetical protein